VPAACNSEYTGLSEVWVANNLLGDHGATELACALYADSWILGLDLRLNAIAETGFKELQSMLVSN
jgi:hypothetical protein